MFILYDDFKRYGLGYFIHPVTALASLNKPTAEFEILQHHSEQTAIDISCQRLRRV